LAPRNFSNCRVDDLPSLSDSGMLEGNFEIRNRIWLV
jgi:hypothetical protein